MKLSQIYLLLTFISIAIGVVLVFVGHVNCGIIIVAMAFVTYLLARTQYKLEKASEDIGNLQFENYKFRRAEWESLGDVPEVWIAKDNDRKVHLFRNKPTYNYRNGRFEPADYPYHEESSYIELKDFSGDLTLFGSPKRVTLNIKHKNMFKS